MFDDWESITAAERIVRCRHSAKEAAAMAKNAPLGYRLRFEELAAQWHRLADELEAEVETSGRGI